MSEKSQSDGWYAVKSADGREQTMGPISNSELKRLARDGRLRRETLLRHTKHTAGKLIAAETIRQLGEIFSAAEAGIEKTKDQNSLIKPAEEVTAKKAAILTPIDASVVAVSDEIDSQLQRFLGDGQDPSVSAKLHARVSELCISGEEILYIAVQNKPVANVAPDAIVLTSRRLIVFRTKLLGRMSFTDSLWRDIHDVHIEENMMGATVCVTDVTGRSDSIDWLPKPQARMIYRHAQEQEEAAFHTRREMTLEEKRASAGHIAIPSQVVASPIPESRDREGTSSPIEKLSQLKEMCDAGLISQDEFEEKKTQILASM